MIVGKGRLLWIQHQPRLKVAIEPDQMRIGIVEQSSSRLEAKRYRQAARKRLNETAIAIRLP